MGSNQGPVLLQLKVWISEEGRAGVGPVITRYFFVSDRSRAISSMVEASRKETQSSDDHTRRISSMIIAGLGKQYREPGSDLDYWGPSDTVGLSLPRSDNPNKYYEAELQGFNVLDCSQENV